MRHRIGGRQFGLPSDQRRALLKGLVRSLLIFQKIKTTETRAKIVANPYITLLEPEHGGHCAFLARPERREGYDGYWAEHTLLRFLLANS